MEDVILEKVSARLETFTGDAFAVPSITSPGDVTLRQLFGGVNPTMDTRPWHTRFLSRSFNGDIRIYERAECGHSQQAPATFKKWLGLSTLPPAGIY